MGAAISLYERLLSCCQRNNSGLVADGSRCSEMALEAEAAAEAAEATAEATAEENAKAEVEPRPEAGLETGIEAGGGEYADGPNAGAGAEAE